MPNRNHPLVAAGSSTSDTPAAERALSRPSVPTTADPETDRVIRITYQRSSFRRLCGHAETGSASPTLHRYASCTPHREHTGMHLQLVAREPAGIVHRARRILEPRLLARVGSRARVSTTPHRGHRPRSMWRISLRTRWICWSGATVRLGERHRSRCHTAARHCGWKRCAPEKLSIVPEVREQAGLGVLKSLTHEVTSRDYSHDSAWI